MTTQPPGASRARPRPIAEPSTLPPRRLPWLAGLVAASMVIAQGWQLARLFPTLGSIVDPASPVVMVDHAIHEYHGALGGRFLAETGVTWGYDPAFMAGYPETPIWDSSGNPSILLSFLGGPGQGYRPYKLGLAAAAIVGFVALLVGGRLAGQGMAEVACASALAWCYFWVEQPVMFLRTGIWAFLVATLGTPLLLGLLARFDRAPSWPAGLALACTGAGLFFAHVTAPILAGPGALLAYLVVLARRHHGWRWHLATWGAATFVVAANLIWLVPMWRFRGLRVGSGFFMTTDDPWFLWNYYTSLSVDGRAGLILLNLGALGISGWWLMGRKTAAAGFGGSALALVALAGFGSLWGPTRTLEPLRFRLSFCLILAVPAGSALALGPGWIARRLGGGTRARWATGLVLAAGLILWGWADRAYLRASVAWLAYRRPLVVGVPPEARPMVDWLRRDTDLSARVLFEDQLRLLEHADAESIHWTPLLPALLGDDRRMFIGGLYQTAFIQHHQFAAFGDFQLGDRRIDRWSDREIDDYARAYNVGWVACWSPLSRFVFDHHPGATRLGTLPRVGSPVPSNNLDEARAIAARGGAEVARRYMLEGDSAYAIYRLERPRSYFLKGKGRVVDAQPNRVELADVEPDANGQAVVSLHWIDSWAAEPPDIKIAPEPTGPDPVPFVRIESRKPIPKLILRNVPGHRQTP